LPPYFWKLAWKSTGWLGMEEEYSFTCPYCWERISMLIDASSGSQTYIEDCEICCNPIEIDYRVNDHTIIRFSAKKLE
jgi:hypothetical protein